MSNSLFEQILRGHSIPLTQLELGQFEIYCSTQNLSLDKWNQISLLLFQQKREHCLHFLQYVQRTELSKPIYNDFIHQDNKVRILNNLFALMLTKATKQYSKSEIDAQILQAKKYLTQCESVMTTNVLNRAYLEYFDGQLNKATNMFNTVIETHEHGSSNEGRLMAMLGLAQIHFLKRNYAKSLQSYKKVLTTFKTLPVKARIGMAYCFFHLQKYEMAKACFVRVLKLDPQNIQAYIGLAVVEQKNENVAEYFRNLSQAVKINKKHPLVLIHLAEHFLIKGDLERATKMAQDGLVEVDKMAKFFIKPNKTAQQLSGFRNDHTELKARFNNILGQVQHIKNNYLQALKYYRLATNPNLIYNDVYLSQVYTQSSNYTESIQVLQKLFKQSSPTISRFLNDSVKDLAYLKSKTPVLTTEEKTCEQAYNEAIAYNKNDVDVKIQLVNQIVETKKARALRLLLSVYKIVELQSGGQNLKPQLVNNIGVLYTQNHEYKQALEYLQPCVDRLKVQTQKLHSRKAQKQAQWAEGNGKQSSEKVQYGKDAQYQALETQCVKTESNWLITLFNLGLVKQKQCLFSQALDIYTQILKPNKHFIDAHIRIAYIYFTQGNFHKSIAILDEAMNESQNKQAQFIRFDKVYSMKLWLLKTWGDQVAAKDGVKQITKHNRDIYSQIFELSMQYEQLMKRQPELAVVKEFLRPNREIYMRMCHEDPHNAFCYMILCVLLLTDKRVSLKQGSELFAQLKQHNSEDIPIVLYNMGLFFLNYDDYDKAKFIFKIYKEKTHDQRGEELSALANMLEGQYPAAIQSAKRNVLLNPVNIKARYQLFYSTEKKVQHERQQEKSRLRSRITTHLQILRKCHKFYSYFSRLNPNDFIRYHESPDMKQLTRTHAQKIRGLCDQRKFYVSSNIDYYEKLQKDEMIKAKEEEERQRKLKIAQQRIQLEVGKENIDVTANGIPADQSDSEELKHRKKQQKRRKALQMAKKKDQEINQKFQEIKQKQRQERQKKLAKMNRQPRQKGTKKREKRPKAQSSQQSVEYESMKSLQDQLSHQSPSQPEIDQMDDEIEAPKRKRRQERREERRERKKKIKKERLQIEDDDDLSNPFSDMESKKSKKESERSEGDSDKKKKKKKEDQPEEEDIDMNQWLL